MHLIASRWSNRWNLSPAQWASARTAFTNVIYPHGLPTSGVDVVQQNFNYAEAGIALPANCTHMTRYTVASPGQRPGGSVQYTYLLYPTTPNNKLVVWMCGHEGWSGYAGNSENHTIQAILAAGYYVLVCDTLSFSYISNPVGEDIVVGGSWTYSAGAWSNIGGTPTHFTEHEVWPLASDGGPDGILQFIHHVMLSANQAMVEVSPTKCILGGHSGGGICGNIVAALDGRYVSWYSNCPGLPLIQTIVTNPTAYLGSPVDWESYLPTITYSSPPYSQDYWGTLRIASSWPGRHSDLVSSLNDEYWFPVNVPLWYELSEAIVDYMREAGSTFTYYLDPIAFPGHVMNTARINRMLALMAND